MNVKRLTALVVEENSARAAQLAQVVRSKGYRVEESYDGWSALMTLMSDIPDLLILKPQLPIVSGAEIAAYVRTGNRRGRVRIVIVSQEPVNGRLRELADAVCEGVVEWLEVPRLLTEAIDHAGAPSRAGGR